MTARALLGAAAMEQLLAVAEEIGDDVSSSQCGRAQRGWPCSCGCWQWTHDGVPPSRSVGGKRVGSRDARRRADNDSGLSRSSGGASSSKRAASLEARHGEGTSSAPAAQPTPALTRTELEAVIARCMKEAKACDTKAGAIEQNADFDRLLGLTVRRELGAEKTSSSELLKPALTAMLEAWDKDGVGLKRVDFRRHLRGECESTRRCTLPIRLVLHVANTYHQYLHCTLRNAAHLKMLRTSKC